MDGDRWREGRERWVKGRERESSRQQPPPAPFFQNAPPRPGDPGHARQDVFGLPGLGLHCHAQVGEGQVDGRRGRRFGNGIGRCAVALVLFAPFVRLHRFDARAAQDEGSASGSRERGGDSGRADEEVGELAHGF